LVSSFLAFQQKIKESDEKKTIKKHSEQHTVLQNPKKIKTSSHKQKKKIKKKINKIYYTK